MKKSDARGKKSLLLLSLCTILFVYAFLPAIPQEIEYHQFAHEEEVISISNFYNVISNLGFIVSGILGFFILKKYSIQSPMVLVLFTGIILTGLGSAYYHLNPSNATLVWDRIPMTLVFTSFFAEIYGCYFNQKQAIHIWIFTLCLGLFSVAYWFYTENSGHGDLRLYAIVQFLPMLLIAIIVLINHRINKIMHLPMILIFACYISAKLVEQYDQYIFDFTDIISGHPIKHFFATLATGTIVWMIYKTYKSKECL